MTKEKINKFAKRGYNDMPERESVERLLINDPKFHHWLRVYFKIRGPFELIHDPLGEYKVDMGVVDEDGKILGLIEVDVFFAWKNEWPSHYKWCHRLGRKRKYWINTPYPYINLTFSANHKDAIVTTREAEIQYPIKDKYFKNKQMTEQIVEVPISDALKFGDWS